MPNILQAALLSLIGFLSLWPSALNAADYRWPIVAVLDGDSLKVDLPGLPPELNPITVRIRGIDAPEAGSKAKCTAEADLAIRATELLESMVMRSGAVSFADPEPDKYFRIVATVLVNGESVGDALIRAGLAREYHGQGARPGWCR